MTEPIGILAPAYVLGEEELSVDSIANRHSVLSRYNMPDRAELWGWGSYRRTQRSRAQLAGASASATIAQGGLRSADIDGLMVCCGDGLNYYGQNQVISELASALGVRGGFVSWIGGAGCASLFSAVQVARALAAGGLYRNLLVIAVDKIEDETERFQRFGVFSDGACSFVVRKGSGIDYAILGAEAAFSVAALTAAGQDLAQKCQLIYDVFERLAAQSGAALDGSALLGSNVFLPIQELELSVMPVKKPVPYRANTVRYGHCAGADPVINLIDFYRDAEHGAVDRALLTSTAHGHFGAILLEPRTRVM
jgi:3-oxoacyl-[acyl-carrier-protein] synthase-3